jgi:hypothetical protein
MLIFIPKVISAELNGTVAAVEVYKSSPPYSRSYRKKELWLSGI